MVNAMHSMRPVARDWRQFCQEVIDATYVSDGRPLDLDRGSLVVVASYLKEVATSTPDFEDRLRQLVAYGAGPRITAAAREVLRRWREN